MESWRDELYHHGILGMKWGGRRYQYKDGSLTPAGRKRYDKQYDKLSTKANNDLARNKSKIEQTAYVRVGQQMRDGGLDKFNAQQQKKYGKNYLQRKGYVDDFNKTFNEMLKKEVSEEYLKYLENNESYKKAQELVDKYGMLEWNEMARSNKQTVDNLRKNIG